jgi:multimeric flavodoxin WrbA
MTKILGIAGSLRNVRHGRGSKKLISELASVDSEAKLKALLEEQTRLIVEDFLAAGRAENKPFDEIYKSLRSMSGERGLSNSEAALAAALWGALSEGAEIDYLSLANHFPPSGAVNDAEGIRAKLRAADGIIISTPVYFGDRGSLVQSLLDFIAADPALRADMVGKIYGGIAVGAKRNGGQETTLIYQMLDMVNLGLLCVGNSSESTAQYGGTAVGGDVGTVQKDAYGLETTIGTGRRVARVAKLGALGSGGQKLKDKFKLDLWLLQRDDGDKGLTFFREWADRFMERHPDVTVRLWDVAHYEVVRCIACDVCPTSVAPREEYRCIITKADDFFVQHHAALIEADAILACAYSPEDRTKVLSEYQQFIERTRYLRRDNYAFSDLVVAPFVVSELDARQNLHLRMLTSLVRHHTILHHPLVGMMSDGQLLNPAKLEANADRFIDAARMMLVGRYLEGGRNDILYNPVGYEISAAKTGDDERSGRIDAAVRKSQETLSQAREKRLVK